MRLGQSRTLSSAPKTTNLGALPVSLQPLVAQTLGQDDPAYYIGSNQSLQNKPNHYSATLSRDGLAINHGDLAFTLGLAHQSYTHPTIDKNRVSYQRGGLTEWYENGPLGVEQGFTLQKKQNQTLVLNISGDISTTISQNKKTIVIANDKTSLNYTGLTAFDSNHKTIPVWFTNSNHNNQIKIAFDDSHASYPITIDPYVQEQKLTADDGAANDELGLSVGMSTDGTRVIVGAFLAKVGNNSGQGAAYVYVRSGTTWTQEAKLTASDGAASDRLGATAVLNSDGSRALVGAYLADVSTNVDQGAAYVYVRSGTTWTQEQKLTASDGLASGRFGIFANFDSSTTRVIIGAYHATNGAAYIFSRSGTTWSQEAELTASDGASGDGFGISDTLTSDGTRALVGSYAADPSGHTNQGLAYVFSRSGTTWTQEQELSAGDGVAGDLFGYFSKISGDGTRLLVGAYHHASVQGATYVYVRNGTTWSQEQELTASDGASNDQFGTTLDLNSDGSRAVIGAPGNASSLGAAYLYTRTGSTWVQAKKVTASDGVAGDNLGYFVAMSSDGSRTILTAPTVTVSGHANQGAAYTYFFPALTVTLAGTGSGTITSTPAGSNMSCGSASCINLFDITSVVSLRAVPDSNSSFSGWSGSCTAGSDPILATVTMSDNESCTATFTAATAHNTSVGGSSSGGGGGGGGWGEPDVASAPAPIPTPQPSIAPVIQPTAMPLGIPSAIAQSSAHVTFSTTLNPGDQGQIVLALQKYLQDHGYLSKTQVLAPIFGPRTKAALMKFQKAHRLTPTGSLGPKTRALLNS